MKKVIGIFLAVCVALLAVLFVPLPQAAVDDGGTRVGRPDPARGAEGGDGPSTQPVKEGLEGAVFEDEPLVGFDPAEYEGIFEAE